MLVDRNPCPVPPPPNHQAATLDSHAECVECGHEQNRVSGRERVARTAARPLGGSVLPGPGGTDRPPVRGRVDQMSDEHPDLYKLAHRTLDAVITAPRRGDREPGAGRAGAG